MQLMIRIFKGFCAFFLVLALACLMYVHFKGEDLSRRVLNALRKELATELQVAHFNIDLLSAFPHIRLDMHDVLLGGKGGSTLALVSELRLTMSLFNLFSDEIRFRKLSLKDGELHVERLADGALSLEVLASNGQSESAGPVLHFNKIHLENIGIRYHEPKANQEYQLHFIDGTIGGTYSHQVLNLNLLGNVRYDQVRIAKDVYLNGATGSVNGKISLDLNQQLYTFEGLAMEIDKQRYVVDGSVRGVEEHLNLDLKLQQTDGDLHSFVKMLPAAYRKQLSYSKLKGTFIAEGFIKGRMSASENPHIHFDLQIEDAEIASVHTKGELRNVQIDGTIDNGAARKLSSTSIDLPVIRGKAYGQKFEASLNFSQLNDPVILCAFDGSLPADFVLDYIGMSEDIKKISGAMHFSNVAIGPLRLSQMDFTDVEHFEGRCTLGNLEVHTTTARYQIPDGTFTLADDTLRISDVHLKLEKDDIVVHGWMSELGDALEGNDPAYLHYGLTLKAENLNISQWIPALATNTSRDGQPQIRPVALKSSAPLRLPEGEMKLTAEQFQYNQINASAISATWNTTTHQLQFVATGEAASGTFDTRGVLETSKGYALQLKVHGENVNMRDCFNQCQNFGQQVLTAEHIRGKSDVKILADLMWDLEGNLNEDEIHVFAGMSIRDGELVGFDMLNQFSDYVHAEDLRHIKFRRIDNFIEVRNGNVYIPAMFIQSNAVNLVVNGIHRLDNHILYNVKLNAGQVLTTKMKKHNPKMTPLPANQKETFNLYFTIAGTLDTYTYDMNRRAAESSFAQSAELRDRIRAQLTAAFGETIDLIEPPEWETIPEYNLEQKGEEFFLEID